MGLKFNGSKILFYSKEQKHFYLGVEGIRGNCEHIGSAKSDEILKKVKKAKSDSEPIPENLSNLEQKPEALNLINIYAELTKKSLDTALSEVAGKEYSYLKTKLSDALITEIVPIGKEIKRLLNDKAYLMQILKKGKEKANIIAEENLKNIREKVGLI